MKTYLVGGAVRDRILGIQSCDQDFVVVGACPEDLTSQGFMKVGADFPVFLHPQTKQEYALARREKKTAPGYHGFSVEFSKDVTLEEDLERRDLTINAIAFDGENYIDPFDGINDLTRKILRPVGNAFMEDPLRILRLCRFKARFTDFTIDQSAYEFASHMHEELKALKRERIRLEMEKALIEKRPSLFFETLRDLGVLEVIFPSLHALIGVPQVEKYHPEGDAFAHTMLVLDHTRDQTTRLDCLYASLLHDIGKAATPADVLPRHIKHEERGVDMAKSFLNAFGIQKYKSFVLAFVKNHLKMGRLHEMRSKKIIELLDAFKIKCVDDLEPLLICARADFSGKGRALSDVPHTKFLIAIVKKLEHIDFKDITQNIPPEEKKDVVLMHKVRALKDIAEII